MRALPRFDPAKAHLNAFVATVVERAVAELFRVRLARKRTAGVLGSLDAPEAAEQPVTVVDLDDCRDPETGAVEPWALAIARRLDSYTEASPTGTGVKVFLFAAKPGPRCKAGRVEIYDRKRMLTVTGAWFDGFPIAVERRQDELTAFYHETFPPDAVTLGGVTPPQPPDRADVELLAVAFVARNGAKIKALFFGDTAAYSSRSEADLALCTHLGFDFVTSEGIDRAFRQSALMRPKWEREDYRARTIGKALAGRTEFYDPSRQRRRGPEVTFATAGGRPPEAAGGMGSLPGSDVRECGLPKPSDGRPAGVPTIMLGTDEFRVNAEAEAALAGAPGVYAHGGRLAYVAAQEREDDEAVVRRPVGAPAIRDLTQPLIREALSRQAVFVRLVEGADGSEERPAAPPAHAVQAIHARSAWKGIPHLEAVVTHPVLLPDGQLLATPGYHRKFGLLLWTPKGLELMVPDRPTDDDVRVALALILDVVTDFPFETPAHQAACVAGLLTPLAWFAFEGPAPLTLIDANTRGSGKGLLADVVSLIVLGHRFPVMSYTADREELRKRITALAAEGERLVLLDNLAGAVGNDVLDGALTSDWWKDRLLGANKVFNGPLHVVWFGTGNNVGYTGGTADALTIANDAMDEDAYRRFLAAALTRAKAHLRPGGAFYLWHADSHGFTVRAACADVGLAVRQCLVWVKSAFTLGRQDYQWRHEPCLYGWAAGAAHTWLGDRSQTTVLEFDKPARNADHPTTKPVELFAYLVGNSCPPGGVVLDPFAGSGTTLFAAEQTGRTAHLVELDPRYCDVVVRRWEEFTCRKAERAETGDQAGVVRGSSGSTGM
ncbi:MAG TPA: DNA methyltransferase [Fimbriiglobus sp.]|nr:DNA methyltransferase [Fimbriiglobus sp.]